MRDMDVCHSSALLESVIHLVGEVPTLIALSCSSARAAITIHRSSPIMLLQGTLLPNEDASQAPGAKGKRARRGSTVAKVPVLGLSSV